MAHFFRVILGIFLACASVFANASFAPVVMYKIVDSTGPTKEAVCRSYVSTLRPTGYYDSYKYDHVDGVVCYYMALNDGINRGIYPIHIEEITGCPTNSIFTADSQCTCNEGFADFNNNGVMSCKSIAENECDQAAALYNSLGSNRETRLPGQYPLAVGISVCYVPENSPPGTKGCKHTFTGDYQMQDLNGAWITEGISLADTEASDGSGTLSCTPGDLDGTNPPKADKPDPDCVRGYPGTVNGVTVCVDASTGNVNSTNWNRTSDAEGNTSDIHRDVSCKGETCTITETTTTKPADGSPPVTNTTTTPNVDRRTYCVSNPKDAVCGTSEDSTGQTRGQDNSGGGNGGKGGNGDNPDTPPSTFGGACPSSFSCEGDAIQCAIASEQHRRDCALYDTPNDESKLYFSESVKTGSRIKDLPGNETIDISNRIDTSDALGGGAGVQDLTIDVMGQSVTLPFSELNPYLAALGDILVMVSFLLAYRIVGRG